MVFVNNFLFDLPEDLQEKIFFYIHQSFMNEIKNKILVVSLINFLQKYEWLDHHEISKQLLSNNI